MAHVVRIILLVFCAYVAAFLAAPSIDPYTIYIQTAVILSVALPAYFLGYRRGRASETELKRGA